MPDLKFEIISSEVKQFAIAPTLSFKLQITNAIENEEVYAAALKCQVMVEAIKRTYNENAKDKLHELFGEPFRWDETLKSFFWTIINIPVPRFTGKTAVEITIPCSEDQAMAAGKYFYAVSDGDVPLAFLFSGTLFYKDARGQFTDFTCSLGKGSVLQNAGKLMAKHDGHLFSQLQVVACTKRNLR